MDPAVSALLRAAEVPGVGAYGLSQAVWEDD